MIVDVAFVLSSTAHLLSEVFLGHINLGPGLLSLILPLLYAQSEVLGHLHGSQLHLGCVTQTELIPDHYTLP